MSFDTQNKFFCVLDRVRKKFFICVSENHENQDFHDFFDTVKKTFIFVNRNFRSEKNLIKNS